MIGAHQTSVLDDLPVGAGGSEGVQINMGAAASKQLHHRAAWRGRSSAAMRQRQRFVPKHGFGSGRQAFRYVWSMRSSLPLLVEAGLARYANLEAATAGQQCSATAKGGFHCRHAAAPTACATAEWPLPNFDHRRDPPGDQQSLWAYA